MHVFYHETIKIKPSGNRNGSEERHLVNSARNALIQSTELLEQAAMRWKQTGLGFTKLVYIIDEQKIKKQIIGIGDHVTQRIELEREAAEQILKITE